MSIGSLTHKPNQSVRTRTRVVSLSQPEPNSRWPHRIILQLLQETMVIGYFTSSYSEEEERDVVHAECHLSCVTQGISPCPEVRWVKKTGELAMNSVYLQVASENNSSDSWLREFQSWVWRDWDCRGFSQSFHVIANFGKCIFQIILRSEVCPKERIFARRYLHSASNIRKLISVQVQW